MKKTNNSEIEGKSQIKGGVIFEPYYLQLQKAIKEDWEVTIKIGEE